MIIGLDDILEESKVYYNSVISGGSAEYENFGLLARRWPSLIINKRRYYFGSEMSVEDVDLFRDSTFKEIFKDYINELSRLDEIGLEDIISLNDLLENIEDE